MAMVWIDYEQMEQLRECKAKLRVPVSKCVAEAVTQWLKYIVPTRLEALGLTPLTPACSQTHRRQRKVERQPPK